MSSLNRTMVLNTLIKHETLTISDLAKYGKSWYNSQKTTICNYLLDELIESKHIYMLNGAIPMYLYHYK